MPRDRLIEEVWGERDVTYNNLEVFIRFLRTKVDAAGQRPRSSTRSAASATASGAPSAEHSLASVPSGRLVFLHGRGHLCSRCRGYWFAIRTSLNHALDQGLRYRLIGLREFLEDVERGGRCTEIASRAERDLATRRAVTRCSTRTAR